MNKFSYLSIFLFASSLGMHSAGLPVASLARKTPVDFQDEVLPVLRANCLACHNQTKSKADVILETPKDIAEADIVVPGKPMESLLFQSAAHLEDPLMPPKENKVSAKSLNPQQLALLKLWIEQGAKGEIRSARKVEWQPLPPGLNPIYSVSVSPDGQYAAAGRANQIFVYDVPSKLLVTRLTDPALLKGGQYKEGVSHRDLVHSLAFNPTGDLLASGGYREVKLWRRQPVKAQRSIALNTDASIIALSPDGQSLAVGEGNNIRLINPNTGAAIKTLAGHKMPVSYVAFSPDNKQLLSGAADGNYHIWTIAAGKFIAPKLELEKPSKITAVTWTTGGKLLISAHEDNIIRSWDVAAALTINATVAKALADAKKAAADKQKIFDTSATAATAAATKTATAKTDATKVATALTAATKDGTTKRTAATTAKKALDGLITTKQKPAQTKATAAATALTKAQTDKTAADKALTVANAEVAKAKTTSENAEKAAKTSETVAAKAKIDDTKAKADVVTAEKAVVDAKKVAAAAKVELDKAKAAEGTADKAGLKPHKEMKGHSQSILALTRVPNNDTQILSGSKDGTVRHWDANTGAAVRSMTHGGAVVAVAASPDGSRFGSAGEIGPAKLWTASNGQIITDLKGSRKSNEDSMGKDRFAAYAKAEVTYYTANLKTETDNHKKADDRVKKATEALKKAEGMPIAEKKKAFDEAEAARKSGEDKYNKLKASYDAMLKTFEEQDKAAKAAEAVTKKAVVAVKVPATDFANKEKAAKTKKAAADSAKKKFDNLIQTQLKPAEAKATTAKAAVTAATTAKVGADKGLATAKAGTPTALKKFNVADGSAKAAEENSKKVAGDSNKKPEEKQAASKAATEKRNAANTAKAELTQAQAKEKTAITAAADAANKLRQAQAAQKTAEAAVTAAKARATAAQKTFDTANKAAATAAKTAAAAKPIADKAKASADAATKESTEKRKLATETQKKRDDLNKQQAASKKTFDDAVKKVATAEGEYKKLEEPRQQAANEAKLSKEALVKAEAVQKEAEGQKATADKQQADADASAKTAKEALAKSDAPTQSIAFSADSKRVVTGGADNLIHIWSATDGKETGNIAGHKGAVNALTITAKGQVISGSADKTAAVWSLTSEWKLERTLGTGGSDSLIVDRATALSFSYDGKQIAIGSGEPSRSGTVHVFNVADGKLTKNLLDVHSDTVMGLQFNADGTQIASGAADKFAKITNLADGKILHSFEGHTHHVLGVAWQYNGRILASVGADNEIKVWNVLTGERAGKVGVGGKEVTSINFVGYTDNAVVTAGDNRVRRVSIPMGNPKNVRDFSGSTDYVYSSSISADGTVVVAGGADAVLRVWNGTSGAVISTFEAPKPETEKVINQ